MEAKLFYRVSNIHTEQGLWYDFKGNFTGLIHTEFNFCSNNELPMPYDQNVAGWLSATETFEELLYWFSEKDILELQKHGYSVSIYEATEYRMYENHWLIKQDSSKFKETITLTKK